MDELWGGSEKLKDAWRASASPESRWACHRGQWVEGLTRLKIWL